MDGWIKPIAHTALRQTNFSHKVIKSWNELLNDVVLVDSLNQLKKELEVFGKYKVFKYEITFKYD